MLDIISLGGNGGAGGHRAVSKLPLAVWWDAWPSPRLQLMRPQVAALASPCAWGPVC